MDTGTSSDPPRQRGRGVGGSGGQGVRGSGGRGVGTHTVSGARGRGPNTARHSLRSVPKHGVAVGRHKDTVKGTLSQQDTPTRRRTGRPGKDPAPDVRTHCDLPKDGSKHVTRIKGTPTQKPLLPTSNRTNLLRNAQVPTSPIITTIISILIAIKVQYFGESFYHCFTTDPLGRDGPPVHPAGDPGSPLSVSLGYRGRRGGRGGTTVFVEGSRTRPQQSRLQALGPRGSWGVRGSVQRPSRPRRVGRHRDRRPCSRWTDLSPQTQRR